METPKIMFDQMSMAQSNGPVKLHPEGFVFMPLVAQSNLI